MQGACVWSLVKELGSYMLPFWCSEKEKEKKKFTIMLTPEFYRGGNQDAERGNDGLRATTPADGWETQKSGLSIRLGFISAATRARRGFLSWHCQGLTVWFWQSHWMCTLPLPHAHHYPWHHPLLHNWGFTFQAEKTNLFMISTPSQLWTFLASRETEKLVIYLSLKSELVTESLHPLWSILNPTFHPYLLVMVSPRKVL